VISRVNYEHPLRGRKILIVEDQYLIAQEMSRLVSKLGGEVVGPAPNVERTRILLDQSLVDFALLDVNLDGEQAHGLADELCRRGVPFIFATGYEAAAMPKRHLSAPHLEKPVVAKALEAAVAKLKLAPVAAGLK
jgi:two-component SAPR family response regulator